MSSSTTQSVYQVPALRFGEAYESLDKLTVADPVTGDPMAEVSLVNAGIIRRDRRKAEGAVRALRQLGIVEIIERCRTAGELFLNGDVVVDGDGATQSPDEYVRLLSATSGLPHTLCRANMEKVHYVLTHMDEILAGLTRRLDYAVIESGLGEAHGVPVSYLPTTDALGAVLPSNSPGVNSIWLPSLALRVPVVLKPGSDEPWTPWRVIRSMLEAGLPKEAFCFYPTTHEGAAEIMQSCGRSIIFGDKKTVDRYADNPNVQVHGPGWSKVLIGEDVVDGWEQYLDVLEQSVAGNSGRSCINASTVVVPRHGRAIAQALAERLARIEPLPAEHPDARLSAFAKPQFAEFIDQSIDEALREPGATDVTSEHRKSDRRVVHEGRTYLLPTVVYCERWSHPLANTEYMCPFVSVVELPQSEMIGKIGPTLVASAITRDERWIEALLAAPEVDRLNLGPVPTTAVRWDQPHEGNLFDFLYRRRAIHREPGW